MQCRPDPETGCSPHVSSSRGVAGNGLPSGGVLGPAGSAGGPWAAVGRELVLIFYNTTEGHTLRDGACRAHALIRVHARVCARACIHRWVRATLRVCRCSTHVHT